MRACPCGSGADFDDCCSPVIRGEQQADTAEALMRSRYSAYAVGEIDYLTDSLHPDSRHDHDPAAARRWAEHSQWLGLEVVSKERGGVADEEGLVEFIAAYKDKSGVRRHHEIGRFKKAEGRWFYLDGSTPKPVTQAREAPKVGRNDPCPCGSGRKYKKCCAK